MESIQHLQDHNGAAVAAPTADINALLARQDLWRARDGRPQAGNALPSGHEALDQALHQGGWPRQGMTELLTEGPCPQALRLLMPALSKCDDGLIVLVNPPARPNAALLHRHGIHSGRLLVLRSDNPNTLLQASLEAASSQTVSAMVVWLNDSKDDATSLRRLHLAAQQGRCWLNVVRDARHAENASPAPLRLTLSNQATGDLAIEVIKQPGGWAGQQVTLSVLPRSVREMYPATAAMPAPTCQTRQSAPRGTPDLNSRFTRRPMQQIERAARSKAPSVAGNLPLPF